MLQRIWDELIQLHIQSALNISKTSKINTLNQDSSIPCTEQAAVLVESDKH